MRALIQSVLRHRRFLAALTVTLGFVLTPARADAQIWWDDEFSQTFATFGANQSVTIANGIGPMARCGGILPVIEIYVVNVSSLGNGASITDVSNPDGLPNTVFPFSGGFFGGETIAFTAPGGNLGPGTYGIVMKSCRDGIFHADSDVFIYPAFEVVIDANIPVLPDPSIAALKDRAHERAESFRRMWQLVTVLEWIERVNMVRECIHLWHLGPAGIAHCAAMWAYHGAMMATIIKKAHHTTDDAISHYVGIHADPPDPLFQQVTPLEPFERVVEDADRPILNAMFRWSNTLGSEAAILQAMLHSMERYQGAALGSNPEWALVHARQLQSYSAALRSQLVSTNAALTAMNNAVQTNPADIDTLAAQWVIVHQRLVTTGFSVIEMQSLMNAGYTQAQINDFGNQIVNDLPPLPGITKAAVQTLFSAQLAANIDFVSELSALESDMDTVIAALLAEPLVTNTRPIANAGGPYSGNESSTLTLDGSASTDPGGAIAAYAWDIDGDGQFDDATGATPSVTFPSSFDGFVGLQVSDAGGNTSVSYAHVTIADVNHAPTISAFTPDSGAVITTVGPTTAFSVTATDADGDPVTVQWLVDGVETATGFTFAYTAASFGQHLLRAEATDHNPAGGTVAHEWIVLVVAADADGDGWGSNVDCNDGNPLVHPFGPEIIGNGIDDDCRADTLDGGSPPTASFTVAPGVKIVGQPVAFANTSQDPDGPVASAWNFGDGQTSNEHNPSHVFATAGIFKVVLTVTDGQGFSATTEQSVTATNLPTASFTYAPAPAVRNTPIQFMDTSSDQDGPIAARSWQFGDGGTSSDLNPIHTFTSAGTFTVTLTVTDGHGATATTTQAVLVNPALTDTTSVSFKIRHGCSSTMSYQFKIGGVLAGTLPPFTQSGCTTTAPVEQTLTVSDPAVLALVTAPVCQVFTLQSTGTGTSAIGWSRVEIGRPGGTEVVRIMNTNQYDGPTAYSAYAAFAGASGGARTFNSVLPNKDGDATPDCSDPDIDGDTKLNAADNCPLISNLNQADADGNGVGDACQDTDADTILDSADNCPLVANTNQFNFDNDATGNACDDDIDADDVLNDVDNCRYIANPDQANSNGDAFGNVCDVAELRFVVEGVNRFYDRTWTMSIDGKAVGTLPSTTVPNTTCTTPPAVLTITDPERLGLLGAVPTCNAFRLAADNRTYLSWSKAEVQLRSGTVNSVVIFATSANSFPTNNACQSLFETTLPTPPVFKEFVPPDFDKDGFFDCEDPDSDGDKVPNAVDNCPTVPNANQANGDTNPLGDACQDTDADGDLDIIDNCPVVANADQANLDGDSFGDVCDLDDDNDTVSDVSDNCPRNVNTNQSNIDGDALGDVCDNDMDGDGDLNSPSQDNCPTVPNADQRNTDGDTLGDVCDADLDGDGVLNAVDNCLYVKNTAQESTNEYGVGNACIVAPITVPWLGVPTQPHQVYSGGTLVLQGVAVYQDTFLPADILSATWDPGDGSPAKPVNVSNPRALEVTHTYTGAVNTPFIARLTITMLNGATRSDEFRVIIQPKTLDVEANMAIDRGLWNLHKSMTASTVGTPAVAAGFWTGGDNIAATAATMQAFGINNHREVGNPLEDPYVDAARRGMRFLENSLAFTNIAVQPAGNPDTNGNGFGLHSTGQTIYITGHIADAFVAMGTPDATAVVGIATRVKGRKYRDLVQDMMDFYWWGQTEIGAGRGGWRYSANSGADHSTAQWAAIAGLAGENAWNIPVPQFVRDENLTYWIKASQDVSTTAARGRLGYTGTTCAAPNCMATTPSGMVQMIFDGVRNDPSVTSGISAEPANEERFQLALKYMAKAMRNAWHTSEYPFAANYYSLFAIAKAFRLAIDTDASGNVVADPVVMIDDAPGGDPPFDWYRNDPAVPNAASPRGVARLLISKQAAGGEWPAAGHWPGSLATAYAVIVLSPTIFELGPAASCSAVPSIVGTGDPVTFDGSSSIHNDPFGKITSYTWDFADGSPVLVNDSPNAAASHTFTRLGTFNVVLTVADSNGLTAQSSCPVSVIDGNRPPIAQAGGPYNFCVGSPMILNASASTDPDGDPLSFAWDLSNPLNFVNPEGTTAIFNVTQKFASLLPGTYQIGLQVSDPTRSTAVFPNINIHAADNLTFCNTPPELTLPADIVTPATNPDGAPVEFVVTATDAHDGPLTPSCSLASGATFPIGETTVTCSVKDSAGLSDTGSFTVTVTNNGPQFTPHEDIEVPATSKDGATVTFTAVGTDLESGPLDAICSPPSGSLFAIGSKLVNCTVSDGHLTDRGSFTVTVLNNPPKFTPPPDITVKATSAAGAVVEFVASGTDVEDGSIPAACTRASGDTFALGTTTMLCSVTDSHGESVSGSFTILVENNAPTFTPPPDITTKATSPAGAEVMFTAKGNDIESGELIAACTPPPGSIFAMTTTTVQCTVTDGDGQTASGSFRVTVTNTPPTFTPRDNIELPATSPAGAAVEFTAAGQDAEDGPLVAVCTPPTGSTFALGTNTVACTVTDVAGATATGTFSVIVTNNAPAITVPADITTPATSPAGAVVPFTVTGSDVEDGALTPACTPLSGSTFTLGGPHTVECSVTDVAGVTVTKSFTVTVTNNRPAFPPPADITRPATNAAGAVVTFDPKGSDIEDGELNAVCTPPSGSTFAIGSHTVECTVTDIAGETARASFTVTVTNNPPTFTPPADITVEALGPLGAPANFSAIGKDLEDGDIPAVCSASSGSVFPIGSTLVSCTVTDSRKVEVGGSFRVNVVDTTPPNFTVSNLVMHATSAAGAVVPYNFTATDTVDGFVPVTCEPVGGSSFAIGVTPVTCVATDAHHNSTKRLFTVTVFNTAPTCEARPSVSEIAWPPNHRWVPVTITGGHDADGDPVLLTVDSIFQDEPINGIADGDTSPDGQGIGTNTVQVRAERAGSPRVPGNGRVYYINFTGNDGRGGLCTGTVTVGVPHDQSPQREEAIGDGPLYNSVTGARQQ